VIRGQVQEARESLRILLEERFGPLPETLTQRLEATDDLEHLRNAFRQAVRIPSLSELVL